ncbi:MAG: putative DNA binding domain-containing protein, partial [Chloroflexi bacterium]|nr:putative DNA binding domain-containing protein [Chloroflexota bacterium]
MKPTDTFLDVLVAALTKAGSYNQLDQVAPAAVLWPDERREWEPILPRLRERLPVLTLGPYAPAERSGPVVWLRCALAEASSEDLPATPLPIVYLPGIGGRALRALAIPGLEPLAEFVYRGVVWTQPDGADWTPVAFLEDPVDGPKVQVRNDEETHAALFRALPVVAGTTVAELRAGAPWKAKDFEELMPGILALIAQGESAGLEFRSCARWRDEEHPQYTYSESIIRKSVAGFLNSRTGGTLLIGVRDDGVVL